MVTASAPRSAITPRIACRSVASGVVRSLLIRSSPTRISTVPITPGLRPAPRRPPSTRYEVVVLPLVPVSPIISSRSDGRP